MVQPKTRTKIIDAMIALAAERPFHEVTLERIAERAGVTLAALRAAYDTRLAVLADFVRRTDERVLAGIDADMAGEGFRDRLFDVLFGRLEALKPHKAAIQSIGAAACRDPLLALELNRIEGGGDGVDARRRRHLGDRRARRGAGAGTRAGLGKSAPHLRSTTMTRASPKPWPSSTGGCVRPSAR